MITNIDEAIKEIQKHQKKAIVAKNNINKSNYIQSGFGGAFYGLPNEVWPSLNNTPLISLLQINTKELPFTIPPLDKFELITFYVHPEIWCEGYANENQKIIVRVYSSLSSLKKLDMPSNLNNKIFQAIEWQAIEDYPCVSHFYNIFESKIYDDISNYIDKLKIDNASGIKIGGWPTLIQRDYDQISDCHLLQIDNNDNYMYCDNGIAYVSYQDDGKWFIEFDSC